MFYVYIIKSKRDGNLYLGSTNDLRKRVKKHNEGLVFSTKSRKGIKIKGVKGLRRG